MPSALRVDHMTRPAYAELVGSRPLIVPMGATEQHGVHLPLGTDALCATAMAERVSARTGALVAPTLVYGYRSIPRSGGGEEFSGTTGLSLSTVVATLREVLEQFVEDGARQLCVLNGHYENQVPVHEVAYDLTRTHPDVQLLTCLWPDLLSTPTLADVYPTDRPYPGVELEHAAFLETSIMLHLHPELVTDDRDPDEQVADFPPYNVYPTPEGLVPRSGSLAPTAGSTAEAGRRIVEECVDGIAAVFATEFGLTNFFVERTPDGR